MWLKTEKAPNEFIQDIFSREQNVSLHQEKAPSKISNCMTSTVVVLICSSLVHMTE